MTGKSVLTRGAVIDFLDEIRKPNGNKKSNTKTFEDVVPDALEKLGLKGTLNTTALEKLLVNLILNIYDVEKTENNKKRETAKNRDASLLMFGLLDGYYHTEEKDGKKVNVSSEERNERYLNDSDFIKLDYPGEGTYQEIKIKDKERKTKSNSAQPRPLNKLTKIAGDCKIKISRELFKLIEGGSYKKYMDESQGPDNVVTPINLPKPYYTLDNFSPISESESALADNLADDDTAGKNEGSIAPVPAKIPWRLKLPIILAGIAMVPLISALSIIIYNYLTTPPEIEEIAAKTNILVSPGEKEYLELDIHPNSADWGQLGSKIGNEDLVGITNDWCAVGLDGLGDKDSDSTSIVIWGGKAEPALVTVTVVKPGSRGK